MIHIYVEKSSDNVNELALKSSLFHKQITMNGEVPSVPITTLAGVSSLSDLLPELPLPTPLPHTLNNKGLLFNPKVAEDAKKVLASQDLNLVSQLVRQLKQTSTDHIELNDSLASDNVDGEVPALLQAILAQDPNVFKGNPTCSSAESVGGQPTQQPQQPSPYQAGPSPCTPGSPARVPPVGGQPFPVPGGSKFQQQFVNMIQADVPTVNGGCQGITNMPAPVNKGIGRSTHKPTTVSSPAQAALPPDPVQVTSQNGQGGSDSSNSHEGMNLMKEMGLKEMCPIIPLTRIEESLKKDKKKSYYNIVSATASGETKLRLKISKIQPDPPDKGNKRNYIDDDDDDEEEEDYTPSKNLTKTRRTGTPIKDMEIHEEFSVSLSERVKRRRKVVGYDEDSDDSGSEMRSSTKKKRRFSDDDFIVKGDKSERMKNEFKLMDPVVSVVDFVKSRKELEKKRSRPRIDVEMASMSVDELMETPTFKRFNAALEGVLEAAEDMDLTEINDDDGGSDSDTIVSRQMLIELSSEAAKLKAMGIMNKVPHEKLVKVLTILQLNIRDGCKVVPASNQDEDGENQLWKELAMDKVLSALDASLTALYIMTAPDMPKEVYIEDVIDRLVLMTKMQLTNSVFPEFDPVYRLDPANKSGYVGNIKQKRAHARGVKNKTTLLLYNKLVEVVGSISDLVNIQELTDTIILQTSTLAVSPFFVENISELQLNSLRLVTSIFTRYEKHRQLIMEDILSSLARLPSSKKNIRSYRLNAEDNIQMVTALTLQLIQCVVRLPTPDDELRPGEDVDEEKKSREMVDKEVVIVTSYETAMRTAHNFLAVFLRKCSTKGDEDYRPLFENFVYDLLATVNKPEWPAAELLLSLLGRLLVQQFTNKHIEMSLRVASLDYLGIVAARLRKDAVSSKFDENVVDDIISFINEKEKEKEEDEEKKSKTPAQKKLSDSERCKHLQKALLEYLVYNAENDPALMFSRQFYIGQWYRDCSMEVEKATKKLESTPTPKPKEKKKPERKSRRRRGRSEHSDEDEEEEMEEEEVEENANDKEKEEQLRQDFDKLKDMQQEAEIRKSHLMQQINSKIGVFANFKPSPSKLDYENACLVTRYLASSRPFSQSFDIYLTQILKVLCETAVAVRTRAMKCLTAVVEADPAILARPDMQRGVHGRFLDQSTSVREAAVELVGKFILVRPELTSQYYDMLSDRILDTGISVRKRVIKIFRDICMEQTEFDKIPEMCMKMIRRVNDEEGIKKLVNDTFQNMWFTPLRESDSKKLLLKVMNITDVVTSCKDTGYEWFEQLLDNLLKKEEETTTKPVMKACEQLVTCLVENVLRLELATEHSTPRLISCFSTLHLFCSVKPDLLIAHTMTIQPYLDIKCSTQGDIMVLHNVARILEAAVPRMEHPSENFLAQLEEDMMKLILKHGMMVLQSCVSCLGAVVNNVTKNHKLVRDCFQKFFGVLSRIMAEHKNDRNGKALQASKPTLLRALFTVGLLCRHFDFDSDDFGEKRVSIKDKIFDVMLYFVSHEEEEVRHKALTGIGFLVTRHYIFMMGKDLRDMYHEFLTSSDAPVRMRCQVLRNLQMYLSEEELRMLKAEEEWKKKHNKDDLKEMGDIQSGMASTIIQVYLKQLLESFFHVQSHVRLAALNVIVLVLKQGLVHPVQIVPYLITMGSDCDSQIRTKADQQLAEIDKKYPGFIQMKAQQGVKMSFRLQPVLQSDPSQLIRGHRQDQDNTIALSSFIYSLIRNNRGHRRALLSSILNMFDDTSKTPLQEMLYMADNLGHFPYQSQEEPLFIIHQIDIIVSVSGSNLIQSFREFINSKTNSSQVFYPDSTDEETGKVKLDEDEEEDLDTLYSKLPENVSELQSLYLTTMGCNLLLTVKQHLKDTYGFTDNKIQRFSPTDQAKVWDRPLNRKTGIVFNPKLVLELVRKLPLPTDLDDEARKQLVVDFLEFKQLMLTIDPDDEEDEDDLPKKLPEKSTTTTTGESKSDDVQIIDNPAEATVNGEVDREKREEQQLQELPKISSSLRHYNSSHKSSSHSSHSNSRSSQRRSGHSSSHRSSHHRSSSHRSSSHKKKKKRRTKRYSDSEEEESEDSDESDPDWS